MDISLIHAGLAGGVALASLPVILHLFMKQTPKHVVFPALRLIRERQKRSKKKLRVKNWLLLLARMALLALMALALARPRLFSQTTLGDQEVPSAVGLVFDTSLSMGYKEKDKTRLDEAKERAGDLLKKMPDSSLVFVVDSGIPGVPQGLSPAAARKQIQDLTLRATTRPLNVAVGQAYAAVADCDRDRHEVYVLTDLARSAWDITRPVEGLAKARKGKSGTASKDKAAKARAADSGIATYVLKLSPKEVRNVTVAEATPSTSVASQGESIEIHAKVRSKGPAAKRTAEFQLDGITRAKVAVELKADGETPLKFTTPKLDAAVPLHQGVVKLSGAPDPLEFDDVRYVTFKVQPALKVLVVADQAIDATFIANALDPEALPAGAPRPYRVNSVSPRKLAELDRDALRDYNCVFLNNVKELSPTGWSRLGAYVHEGGGLVIGLGDRCLPESYNHTTAAQLIPASLKKPADMRAKSDFAFGKVSDLTHPLFKRYHREIEAEIAQVPVYRYWSITAPEGSRTLLAYANGDPALVERSFRTAKTGRVLLWTTPLARRSDPKSPEAWNEFPLDVSFSFYLLMNQTVPYLAGTSDEKLNYEAGQDAVLPIDPTRPFKNYTVQGSDGKASQRLTPPATSDSLLVVSPGIGQWTVTGSNPEGDKMTLGFSVNPPLSESEFVPLETKDLDALFGKGEYELADTSESLSKVVTIRRVGHEIFPWLMALILILVTLENLLANKFYRESTPRPAVGVA